MVDGSDDNNIIIRSNMIYYYKAKKLRMCKEYLYSNASHLILFESAIYRYVPIWINNVSGDIILFKLRGTLALIQLYVEKTIFGIH